MLNRKTLHSIDNWTGLLIIVIKPGLLIIVIKPGLLIIALI